MTEVVRSKHNTLLFQHLSPPKNENNGESSSELHTEIDSENKSFIHARDFSPIDHQALNDPKILQRTKSNLRKKGKV